jgi:hypothetical protein
MTDQRTIDAPRPKRLFRPDDFEYRPDVNLFSHRPTGIFWIARAVDSVLRPIEVDGKPMAASDWLKRQGGKR